MAFEFGSNNQISRMCNAVQNQNFSSPANFEKSYLINCWSYQSTKITVGKMWKSSISLVFNSWSDSSRVSTRIIFSDCRLQRWCQNVRFEVFLANSRMATYLGASTARCGDYHISVTVPFARWCRSTAWTCRVHFPSLSTLLSLLLLPLLNPL
jgi:hypothetical protein